jgi:hypothetical protein
MIAILAETKKNFSPGGEKLKVGIVIQEKEVRTEDTEHSSGRGAAA